MKIRCYLDGRTKTAFKRAGAVFNIFLFVLVFGCSAGISQQSLSKVTYMGTFFELQKSPDAFIGEIVVLGGKILEARISSASSELMVLESPLNNRHRPANLDQSKGRFLIQSEQLLDPAIYQKGTLLTVVGIIKGSKVRAIGGFNYAYPLLEAIEIKLWPEVNQTHPSIHFGIGVGTTF